MMYSVSNAETGRIGLNRNGKREPLSNTNGLTGARSSPLTDLSVSLSIGQAKRPIAPSGATRHAPGMHLLLLPSGALLVVCPDGRAVRVDREGRIFGRM